MWLTSRFYAAVRPSDDNRTLQGARGWSATDAAHVVAPRAFLNLITTSKLDYSDYVTHGKVTNRIYVCLRILDKLPRCRHPNTDDSPKFRVAIIKLTSTEKTSNWLSSVWTMVLDVSRIYLPVSVECRDPCSERIYFILHGVSIS